MGRVRRTAPAFASLVSLDRLVTYTVSTRPAMSLAIHILLFMNKPPE